MTIVRKKIEELMNVRGIGEASFLKLKSLVTLTPPRTERAAAQTPQRPRGVAEAARYLASRMAMARSHAVMRSAHVALRFDEDPSGITFRMFAEGSEGSEGSRRARPVTRLMVLPFRLLRPDAEIDFLAFSLADAVANSLSPLESLVVRSTLAADR